ncbi:MAG: AIR synthase-related protein, partial [Ktedonobacterales bacterium]
GMVGLLEDRAPTPSAFQSAGDVVALLGNWTTDPATLGGSTYLKALYDTVAGRPTQLDLERERAVQRLTLDAIAAGLIRSAHDCSDGGLAVALAECCIWSGLGFRFDGDAALLPAEGDALAATALCYGEAPSRIVVSLPAERWDELAALAGAAVPLTRLGVVEGDRLTFAGQHIDIPVRDLHAVWRNGLAHSLRGAIANPEE